MQLPLEIPTRDVSLSEAAEGNIRAKAASLRDLLRQHCGLPGGRGRAGPAPPQGPIHRAHRSERARDRAGSGSSRR